MLQQAERVIRWFEKDGDALVGELWIGEVDLFELQKLFNIPEENPMYDCYPIETKEQIAYLQKVTGHVIDPKTCNFFLECDAYGGLPYSPLGILQQAT